MAVCSPLIFMIYIKQALFLLKLAKLFSGLRLQQHDLHKHNHPNGPENFWSSLLVFQHSFLHWKNMLKINLTWVLFTTDLLGVEKRQDFLPVV